MYYRYKSKRRNKRVLKLLAVTLIVGLAAYAAYINRSHLLFWKYSHNKLIQKLDATKKIADPAAREAALQAIAKACDGYRDDNQLSADGFLLAGSAHFALGECYSGGTFSEKLIYEGPTCALSDKAREEYLQAIRLIKKGVALSGEREADGRYLLMLARSSFMTGFYGMQRIYAMVSAVKPAEGFLDIDDLRFSAIVHIQNGREDRGLEMLRSRGRVSDTVEGQLLLASAYCIARRYTNAIVEYQRIMNRTSDSRVQKLIHINLGKIYFNQALYSESLNHFTDALGIDERDNQLKVWIGKNYSALGDKIKAKAIWSEVLAADGTNEEVKKLLGHM